MVKTNCTRHGFEISSLSTAYRTTSNWSIESNDNVKIISPIDPKRVNTEITCGYYLHKRTLGEGSFGKIKLVTHLKTFQLAALKVINKKRFRNDEDRQMVQNEIDSLKVLRHRNIVRLLQVIDTDKTIYLVQEYCSGGDLYHYVKMKGQLSNVESHEIFVTLIGCLDYIHEQGFSHGDIRPENVLLDSSNRIKLIGFRFFHSLFECNIAQPTTDLATMQTQQHLNVEYMAPEMFTSTTNIPTPATDIWSSGILLYFMLTGTLPFTDESLARLFVKIQTGHFEIQCELVDDVHDLIVHILNVDPTKRANVKQIMHHKWVRDGQLTMNGNRNGTIIEHDYGDRLCDIVVNECMTLHSDDVRDIVHLRYNIRYKFGYHTATYWLIKENYHHFKKLGLKSATTDRGDKHLDRSIQIAPATKKKNKMTFTVGPNCRRPTPSSIENGCRLLRRHTLLESRAVPNVRKVNVKLEKCKQLEASKGAITTSLTDDANQSSSECDCTSPQFDSNRNKVGKLRKDSSIDQLSASLHDKPNYVDQMWPHHGKTRFNLRRIFSKPQISDQRSNKSDRSIECDSGDDDGDGRSNDNVQILSHGSNYSLRKILSRRFSFAFATKSKLFPDRSQINSASTTINNTNNDYDNNFVVDGSSIQNECNKKRVECRLFRRRQSVSSLAETTDSDEQRVNRSKTIRYSRVDSEDEHHHHQQQQQHSIEADGHLGSSSINVSTIMWDNAQPGSITNTSESKQSISSISISSIVNSSSSGTSASTNLSADQLLNVRETRVNAMKKINRKKTIPFGRGGITTSVAIITRYNNYEECRNEAVGLLTKKGINCKADKHKLHCCLSTMNVVIVAFQLEFQTFPSLSRSSFVMIKVKRIRGGVDDFSTIVSDLTQHFERYRIKSH